MHKVGFIGRGLWELANENMPAANYVALPTNKIIWC